MRTRGALGLLLVGALAGASVVGDTITLASGEHWIVLANAVGLSARASVSAVIGVVKGTSTMMRVAFGLVAQLPILVGIDAIRRLQ